MSDCIFCKIVKGGSPVYKIYEDDFALAFLNINPVSSGHSLVISKEHFSHLDEVSDEILEKLSLAIKKTVKILQEKLGVKDYNIIQNNGEIAGQEISHIHFHIIPRFKDDGLEFWPAASVTSEELIAVYNKIKN
jgi:histidine triad (HIT) family protein